MIHALLLAAAQAAAPLPAPAPPPPVAPAALTRVALDTSAGRIVLELETARAPITAANFLRYVDGKRLDGVVFYRAVKVAPDFGFVQFGTQNAPKRTLPPIRHEPTTQTGVHHTDGAISVARFAPGTARGDFTISVGDQTAGLDAHPDQPGDNQGFAAFGRVVEGMDVVKRILDGATDPAKGEGVMKGQFLLAPVTVTRARRLQAGGDGSGGGT
jgi:peptidyl-prolyl cis-trans isomerase A (cyclophilin A)